MFREYVFVSPQMAWYKKTKGDRPEQTPKKQVTTQKGEFYLSSQIAKQNHQKFEAACYITILYIYLPKFPAKELFAVIKY